MSQATEIYSREFDSIFLKLPRATRERIEARITQIGSRLPEFAHHRLQARPEYRLRVGDFRIIYEFDLARNELYLVTLGHRSDVYRHG